MKSISAHFAALTLAGLLAVSLFPFIARGQVTNGVLTGVVKDASGSVVRGANVVVRNTQTNQTRSTTSDDDGLYRITELLPGNYQVRAEAQGFKAAVYPEITVAVAENKRLDFALAVGAISETVEVTQQAPLVETEQGSLSGVVNQRKIVDLPLNGRNVYQLALLQSGAVAMDNSGLQTRTPAVNGQRPRGNNFLLDGISNNFDFLTGDPVITPNVDSVQEFRIITNNFSAEYGRNSGSVINVVTKSGTNAFHGAAWEFHRNSALDAREFFDRRKPNFIQNQFGGAFGGPINRDRTFFFGSYEGFRSVFGRSQVVTVETPQLRQYVQNNFPNSVAAFLFKTFQAPVPATNLRDIGTPVKGPRFQSVANDPTVVNNPNYVRQASGLYLNQAQTALDGIPDIGDVAVTINDRITNDQYSGRLDHNFNGDKDHLYGRYYLSDNFQPKQTPSPRGNFDTSLSRRLQNFGIVETHSFSTTVVNEFRAGYVRDKEFWNPNFPGVPNITISSPSIVGYGATVTWPRVVITNTFQFSDVVTWSRGRHGVKLGGEVRRVQENGDWFQNRGIVRFYDPLDFAQDEPNTARGGINPGRLRIATNPVGLRNTEFGVFIQDDWKVTPYLTLNIGLRYELFGRVRDIRDRLGNIIPPAGTGVLAGIATATAGTVKSVAAGDHNNFAPRLGFAWDPFHNGKTSVRGGFGVSYNKIFNNAIGVARLNPPTYSFSVISPILTPAQAGIPIIYGPPPGQPVRITGPGDNTGTDGQSGVIGNIIGYNPAHGFGTQNLRAIDPNLLDPYAENWFLGVQRQLTPDWAVEVNYAGSVGRKLEMRVEANSRPGDLLDGQLNRPNPRFESVRLLTSAGASSYHSLQMQVNKRLSRGFSFQTSYTFSKTLDNSSDMWGPLNEGEDLDVAQDTNNLRLQKALSTLDVPQRLAINAIWELPFLRGRKGMLSGLLGGWQLNGIGQFQSGLPFTVYTSNPFPAGDYNADGNTNDRPNVPSFGTRLNNVSRSSYITGLFKASDFPAPAPGTNGNLPRNAYRGPGLATVDMSLFKSFPMRFINETAQFQFRMETFNTFNRVNLRQAFGNLTSPQFGKSNSTFNARQIQFAAKIIF